MPLFKKKKQELTKTNSQGGSVTAVQGLSQIIHNGAVGIAWKSVPATETVSSMASVSTAESTYDPHLRMRTKSRLSKTLQEFLDDHGALAYFIQFMDLEGAKHLVKFWLEVQSFRSATLMRTAKVPSDNSSSPSAIKRTKCNNKNAKSVSFQLDENLEKKRNKPSNSDRNSSLDDSDTLSNDSTPVFSDSEVDKSDISNSSGGVNVKIEGNELSSQGERSQGTKRKTSSEQDAMHIFKKYIANDAPCSVGVTEEIRNKLLENLGKTDEVKIDPECFTEAQNFVYDKMEESYFPNFLRSSFHCKHQVDMLTTEQVFLADILYNDSTLFYFMEFMEQEGVRHLVDFLLMAENFRTQLLAKRESGYDIEQAQDDAMVIYDKYFSLQATSPLGLSDQIRFELEQNICTETGLQPDCFVKPVMILLQYIEKTYLPQFLSSQLYFKYLSECIVTIQTNGLLHGHRKRSGSDSSSSEISSLSQQTHQNTLLAMDSKQPGNPANKNKPVKGIMGENDMRIDVGQFDPDALWKRNMSGKLQMARVDKYGKLYSEFEPEPERKHSSKLTKAVLKLVNWEDDKGQEAMAWQVAEMIVKDVCSLTLGNSESNKVYQAKTLPPL